MLHQEELRSALGSIPAVTIDGPWLRAVDARLLLPGPAGSPDGTTSGPLWGGGARIHGARYTPKGSFDSLYLASDLETLGAEIGAVVGASHRVSPTKDPFTVVHVRGRLTHVLDLRDPAVRDALATTREELAAPWRFEPSPPTQRLGDATHGSKRFVALVAPSARGRGRGFVLAVFTERLGQFPPSFLEAVDASGTLSRRLP
jgi:RES domain-containing protein